MEDNTPNGQELEDYKYGLSVQRKLDSTPASCQLNQMFAKRLITPIRQVWNSIAADMMDDEEITNENVIEYCIDADHLDLIAGDKEANDMVREQCKVHGHTRVVKFLSRNIQIL